MATQFFMCTTCGNVIVKFVNGGPIPVCCGHQMELLHPNTVDGVTEKHLPAIRHSDCHTLEVEIGSLPHPMDERHHICFICLETDKGIHVCWLKPQHPAVATFELGNEKPVAVYEYCNLHGLWKIDLS